MQDSPGARSMPCCIGQSLPEPPSGDALLYRLPEENRKGLDNMGSEGGTATARGGGGNYLFPNLQQDVVDSALYDAELGDLHTVMRGPTGGIHVVHLELVELFSLLLALAQLRLRRSSAKARKRQARSREEPKHAKCREPPSFAKTRSNSCGAPQGAASDLQAGSSGEPRRGLGECGAPEAGWQRDPAPLALESAQRKKQRGSTGRPMLSTSEAEWNRAWGISMLERRLR